MEFKHIFTIKEILNRIEKTKLNNLYERINMLFKGYSRLATKELIKEIRSILIKEHKKTLKHLDKMENECDKVK